MTRPRARPLDPTWVEHEGQRLLVLRDRVGLCREPVVVSWPVAMLLSLCDGARTPDELRAAFHVRAGQSIGATRLGQILRQLEEALVLEGEPARRAEAAALAAYREAPHRPPALADSVYPADPDALARAVEGYLPPARGADRIIASPELPGDPRDIRGVVSPHIDYQRGGPIYGLTWQAAAPAVREAEAIVIFGTDHVGGPGRVTPTRQRYATPWGVLPTDPAVVDALAAALGEGAAFAEELHHRTEHSIELAAVWVHYYRRDDPCPVIPILCGSFHRYTEGEADPAAEPQFEALLGALRESLAGRRVLYVSAADLAHVGPAFGDVDPLDADDRARLEAADGTLVGRICQGDAAGFLAESREERDCRRVCGLPPTYLMLRALGSARGTALGYDQCPADATGGSLVSIGGVTLW